MPSFYKENTDFAGTVARIQEVFGSACVPVTVPKPDKSGVVDVFGGDIPADMADLAAETRNALMERAAETVRVVNDPVSLRLLNEKLLPLQFPEFTAPTLVSNQPERLHAFLATHGRIVLKPLNDCSGRGVELVGQSDESQWRHDVAYDLGSFI